MRRSPSGRPSPAKLARALEWLTEHAHENLGTEMAVRAVIDGADQWQVDVSDGSGGATGVSVWVPGGQWFLEADAEPATLALAEVVAGALRPPTKVTTSGKVKDWLRPWLVGDKARWAITREHDLFAMACTEPVVAGDGRWATPSDRRALQEYQTAYNKERGTSTAPDWAALLTRPSIAVLEVEGRIVAVVKRTGITGRYATIGGTWTHPNLRGQGLATSLTAFITAALLRELPAVHLIVDDDNVAAIAVYRSVGFLEVGRCYMAYLGPETRRSPE